MPNQRIPQVFTLIRNESSTPVAWAQRKNLRGKSDKFIYLL